MTHGVKLISLSVQDVGPLAGKIHLGPFSGGVSVISGRNEAGKSTLVEALRAGLFERHDAKHQGIKALQTHGTRNAPEIWVELEIGGERVSVHKRFIDKPFVEVRLPGGGAAYHGAEAEDLLLARLDGRRAGRSGGTKNDMGLWGLLWVTQDDSAHADPGEALDENVRGALSDAVGRQVGQMMGGKHGERLRTQVLEHAARYFTRKTGAKTGEYKAAEERRIAADERVRKIGQAVAEIEDLATERAALANQLVEKDRQLPALEAEHAAAITAHRRAESLEVAARETAARLATAEAELAAVQGSLAARALLVEEALKLDGEIRKNDEAIAELDKTLEHLTQVALDARARVAEARNTALAARAAFDDATQHLEETRRRDEATRLSVELAKAEETAVELDALVRRQKAESLDEPTFEHLQSLASRVVELRARLDAEGTRIVVYPADGEPIVRSFASTSTLEVPALGFLEVEPARPGLAQAVVEGGKRRAKFEEALLSLGVANMQTARERFAGRAEAEAEQETLERRKKELAPAGLDVLEQKVTASQAERARLQTALDEATKADAGREAIVRELATNRMDDAAIDGLREKEKAVAVLRAACDAMGTQVDMVALKDLRFRSGTTAVPEALAAGQRKPITLTEATTIVLEGIAELKFEPRGEDLAKSRAKLARAERDLVASLELLEVASMTDAAESARGWTTLETGRRRETDRLAQAAPQGIHKLRIEVEKFRERTHAEEESLAEAKKAFARSAQVEVALAREHVTKEALVRLGRFEVELRRSEAEVEKLQARVRAVSGPVAGGTSREWAVSETTRPAAVAGVIWEVVPGEFGDGLDVDGLERRFRETLVGAGVVDLAAAKIRYKTGLKLTEQISTLGKQLQNLAPDGLDALRARAAALVGARSSGSDLVEADIVGLQAAVKQSDERWRMAQATVDVVTEAADLAERAREAHHGSMREFHGVRKTKAERRDTVTEKLAALREVEEDTNLSDRHASALSARSDMLERARQAAVDLEAATPQLLHGEVLRADGAIASWKKSVEKLKDDALRLKTLLDKAAVEGRFEELGEAQAEQEEAVETLARIEREAGAAQLLTDVLEQTYTESQRLFLAPVLQEAAPYLTKLRPGTEIRMTRDLKLDKVVRRGAEEDFGQLSGGTREQLSVIVRLALARVMARDKRSLPLILDDTMGWTDDGRFLSMVQILRDASSEFQIILLTCHPSRFDRFQAEYSVDLDRLKEARPLTTAALGVG